MPIYFQSMLGPAVNRQPGFRRRTRRAKQTPRRTTLLAGCLPACLPGWLAGSGCLGWLAGWLGLAGWCRLGGWLADSWTAVSRLAGDADWLTGTPAGSIWLAWAGSLRLVFHSHCRLAVQLSAFCLRGYALTGSLLISVSLCFLP